MDWTDLSLLYPDLLSQLSVAYSWTTFCLQLEKSSKRTSEKSNPSKFKFSLGLVFTRNTSCPRWYLNCSLLWKDRWRNFHTLHSREQVCKESTYHCDFSGFVMISVHTEWISGIEDCSYSWWDFTTLYKSLRMMKTSEGFMGLGFW